MRFIACSVAFLLIVAGVAVLTGCIPITQRVELREYARRAEAWRREGADAKKVRAALGDPLSVQPTADGGQRLEFQVMVSSRAAFATLCGIVPMQDWKHEPHRLVLDMDHYGRVRSYQAE
jgi:hypothetical protein